MPLLDVSFMTVDPMLADCFDVRRRLNVVGANGRVAAEPDQYYTGVMGVVTQDDPGDLIKTEDSQSVPRRIFIASKFQFIPLAPGQQPDEVTWAGTVYTVETTFPYSRFGEGFYECLCLFRGPVPPLQ